MKFLERFSGKIFAFVGMPQSDSSRIEKRHKETTAQWRNEWKYDISLADMIQIRQRLQAVAKRDSPSGGRYRVRSLYFDDWRDSALWEKEAGLNNREKFRIRYYNGDDTLIHLEKKSKRNGLCKKDVQRIDEVMVKALLNGDDDWMMEETEPGKPSRPLAAELYAKMRLYGLTPRVIVDYEREAYTYEAGNVRVTFDTDLRMGFQCGDFLTPDCALAPTGATPLIMEVKWNGFLPVVIRDSIQTRKNLAQAFSKYAQCRMAGR